MLQKRTIRLNGFSSEVLTSVIAAAILLLQGVNECLRPCSLRSIRRFLLEPDQSTCPEGRTGVGEWVVRIGRDRCVVLLVEDNAVISLTLVDELESLGYEVVGPMGAASEALCWLETHTPDLVLLDVSLRDGLCVELAYDLKRRGVPFLVYSGHSHLKDERAFEGVLWVQKPSPFSEIAQRLASLRPLGRQAVAG